MFSFLLLLLFSCFYTYSRYFNFSDSQSKHHLILKITRLDAENRVYRDYIDQLQMKIYDLQADQLQFGSSFHPSTHLTNSALNASYSSPSFHSKKRKLEYLDDHEDSQQEAQHPNSPVSEISLPISTPLKFELNQSDFITSAPVSFHGHPTVKREPLNDPKFLDLLKKVRSFEYRYKDTLVHTPQPASSSHATLAPVTLKQCLDTWWKHNVFNPQSTSIPTPASASTDSSLCKDEKDNEDDHDHDYCDGLSEATTVVDENEDLKSNMEGLYEEEEQQEQEKEQESKL